MQFATGTEYNLCPSSDNQPESSTCPRREMTPAGVYQAEEYQPLNPYVQGNSWVWEEPSFQPDAQPLSWIGPGEGHLTVEPFVQSSALSYYNPNQWSVLSLTRLDRSVPYTMEPPYLQCDALDVPQNYTVPTDYGTQPIRYPDQPGYCTNWETAVSQNNLHSSHIGSEWSNGNYSDINVMQSCQELGNASASDYPYDQHSQSLSYRNCPYQEESGSNGNGQAEWTWNMPASEDALAISSNLYPSPFQAIQPRYTLPSFVATSQAQHAASLSNASHLDNIVQSPHPIYPLNSVQSGTWTNNEPAPTDDFNSMLPSHSSGYPASPDPTTPPPPPATAITATTTPETASPAPAPPGDKHKGKRVAVTNRTMELLHWCFPQPDGVCRLCSCCFKEPQYTRPDFQMEHLASTHVIQVVKNVDSYSQYLRQNSFSGQEGHPMLIQTRAQFAYARKVAEKLRCNHCDKDTSFVLRGKRRIKEHMKLLLHAKLGETIRAEEEERLIALIPLETKWHDLCDEVLYNIPRY